MMILIFLNSFGGTMPGFLDNARLPTLYPPGYVFGIVWFFLFILFGVFLATATDTTYQWLGLAFYAVTLAWTPLFVYSQSFATGFYYILFLWALTIAFSSYTKSLWLIPQLIWITFATMLAYSLYRLN
jgi:tryptophan-rich sensory protein